MWTLSSLLLALAVTQTQVIVADSACPRYISDKSSCGGFNCSGGIVVNRKDCPRCFQCAQQKNERCNSESRSDPSTSMLYCDDGLDCVDGVCQGTADRSCPRGTTFTVGCLICSCSEGRTRCDKNPEAERRCPTPPTPLPPLPPPCPSGHIRRRTAESCCEEYECVASCLSTSGRCEPGAPPKILRRPPAKITSFVGDPVSFTFTVTGSNVGYDIVQPSDGATYTVEEVERVNGTVIFKAYKITVRGSVEGIYNVSVFDDVETLHVVTMVRYVKAPSVSKFCGFEVEEEMCRWKSSSKHGVIWQRQKGPARGTLDTTETGPQAGFEGSEYYVYVERKSAYEANYRASLCSRKIQPKQNYTRMSFAYHMHGKDVGDLRVKQTINFGSLKNSTILWKLSGNQSDEWQTADVLLTTESSLYKHMTICFGVRIGGGGTEGDIAIDSIKFS